MRRAVWWIVGTTQLGIVQEPISSSQLGLVFPGIPMAIFTCLWGSQQKYGKKQHCNFTAGSQGPEAPVSCAWSSFLGVECSAEKGPKKPQRNNVQ